MIWAFHGEPQRANGIICSSPKKTLNVCSDSPAWAPSLKQGYRGTLDTERQRNKYCDWGISQCEWDVVSSSSSSSSSCSSSRSSKSSSNISSSSSSTSSSLLVVVVAPGSRQSRHIRHRTAKK